MKTAKFQKGDWTFDFQYDCLRFKILCVSTKKEGEPMYKVEKWIFNPNCDPSYQGIEWCSERYLTK